MYKRQSENLKLAPDIGRRMDADVVRWTDGGIGCGATAGDEWTAREGPAQIEPGTDAGKKPKAPMRTPATTSARPT